MWIIHVDRRKENEIKPVSNHIFQMCCAAGVQAMVEPLQALAAIIVDYLTRDNATGKEFMKNICTYYSALIFTTSMISDLDRRYVNEEHGDHHAFRIRGNVHSSLSLELIPIENNLIQQPRFTQIYIFDSANELQNRMNVASNCDVNPHTMQSLRNMTHEVNPFVDLFKTMEEIDTEQPGGMRDIRMVLHAESSPKARRYKAPTDDEIGVLSVGGEDESSILPCNKDRDIVLHLKGNVESDGFQRINELH
ncbi:hypothetical protein [Parasitella parasitica]|uniref:Uncharacterized protein n=1 Tax=Parasitella parasitica TaxID=35722 RepID=A0A0B7NKM1_9FUNG|nr:hypothetical protein [Parasitella parasitica]